MMFATLVVGVVLGAVLMAMRRWRTQAVPSIGVVRLDATTPSTIDVVHSTDAAKMYHVRLARGRFGRTLTDAELRSECGVLVASLGRIAQCSDVTVSGSATLELLRQVFIAAPTWAKSVRWHVVASDDIEREIRACRRREARREPPL